MTEGEKEQIKLRAVFHNGVGLAFVAVGGLAPTVALMTKQVDRATIYQGTLIFMGGLLVGWLFHMRALFILGEIDNPLDVERVKRQNVLLTVVLVVLFGLFWYLTHSSN
ncbi:hypothetical protein EJ077_16710 [Mesorhizobium sp. M8A.F.Ca.ET.057.01.1.1]|uniref:hypothetical protein n=1 Tax=Mesorhizobium sp. M8A.F.Ca.ET.057.01.1.1 TaxID=2493679 RepID=UPI000F74C210|nr:hypothetical protein [Mesorhizobium sp. M8A.F.Ca.ET.057.01.1.1]AZO54905.1 hypothetical protein EJ077_16710 [Mesorhizobium sp. M8A.F.Ca.ET.057.01.1.1]